MVRISHCDKCGMSHIPGIKCPKPMTPERMHKWAKRRLKEIEEFEKASRKACKRDKRRIKASA